VSLWVAGSRTWGNVAAAPSVSFFGGPVLTSGVLWVVLHLVDGYWFGIAFIRLKGASVIAVDIRSHRSTWEGQYLS
jgi:hypothetical protein